MGRKFCLLLTPPLKTRWGALPGVAKRTTFPAPHFINNFCYRVLKLIGKIVFIRFPYWLTKLKVALQRWCEFRQGFCTIVPNACTNVAKCGFGPRKYPCNVEGFAWGASLRQIKPGGSPGCRGLHRGSRESRERGLLGDGYKVPFTALPQMSMT